MQSIINHFKNLPYKMIFISMAVQLVALIAMDFVFGLHGFARFAISCCVYLIALTLQIWWKIREPKIEYYSDE